MTQDEIIESMSGFFETFGATLSTTLWGQYWEALQDVNPGDLDDAMSDLRKNHKYRNAPLPYEILNSANLARKRRVLATKEPEPSADFDPGDCVRMNHRFDQFDIELSLLVFKRDPKPYHCTRCGDSSWVQFQKPGPTWLYGTAPPMLNYTERCHCHATNPVLQRQREQNAHYAAKSGGKDERSRS